MHLQVSSNVYIQKTAGHPFVPLCFGRFPLYFYRYVIVMWGLHYKRRVKGVPAGNQPVLDSVAPAGLSDVPK